jgi:hypothetical protein
MNTRLITSLKTLFSDRTVLAFTAALLLAGIAYILFVVFSLRPSELQVAAHYSAFGETHYYRDKWYYLISFAVFGLVFMIVHISVLVKLASQGLRSLAVAFGWLSVILVPLLFIFTRSVLGVAF